MKKNIVYAIFLLFCLSLYVGCRKCGIQEWQDQYRTLLAGLDLTCDNVDSTLYMSATVLNKEVCYYDGKENRRFSFGIGNKFTTSSPSLTVGEVPKNARRSAVLDFCVAKEGEEFLQILFPDFPIEVDTIRYLDSLFAIKNHHIMSAEDVSVNTNKGLPDKYNTDFVVNMVLVSTIQASGSGGTIYEISSLYGSQKNSFLKIKNARKLQEADGIYYDLEFEFECNLYHFPQNGKSGLWSPLKKGVFVGKVKGASR